MKLKELLAHVRCSKLRDTALPQLWGDPELLRYFNQAQKEFAVRTHCLVDDTEDFTTFDTVVGQQVYDLDQRIVFVGEADILVGESGSENWLPLHDAMRHKVRRTKSAGRPSCYTAQVRTNTLRLAPVPDAVYTIQLVVAHKPLEPLNSPDQEPEIDELYHLALTDYVVWQALVSNNPEGADMASATGFRNAWDVAIRDAKRDIMRMRAGANTQARSNWTGKR